MVFYLAGIRPLIDWVATAVAWPFKPSMETPALKGEGKVIILDFAAL